MPLLLWLECFFRQLRFHYFACDKHYVDPMGMLSALSISAAIDVEPLLCDVSYERPCWGLDAIAIRAFIVLRLDLFLVTIFKHTEQYRCNKIDIITPAKQHGRRNTEMSGMLI